MVLIQSLHEALQLRVLHLRRLLVAEEEDLGLQVVVGGDLAGPRRENAARSPDQLPDLESPLRPLLGRRRPVDEFV